MGEVGNENIECIPEKDSKQCNDYFWVTFEVSNVFRIGLSLKPIHRVKLSLFKSLIHSVESGDGKKTTLQVFCWEVNLRLGCEFDRGQKKFLFFALFQSSQTLNLFFLRFRKKLFGLLTNPSRLDDRSYFFVLRKK